MIDPGTPDAELVRRVLDGDRDAFGAVYDRYGDRLYDFCHSLLRHREEAADAVADTFVSFAERLGQLRDPSRLRPWLYSIARHEGMRRLEQRNRTVSDAELLDMPDPAEDPAAAAEEAALRALVWAAAAGLADRDRALLDLHLRQGLDGADLGEAMGVTASHAYVLLNRLRAQVERSLGALLIARLGRDDCDELAALLTDWDGSFSPLIRKRVARHVEKCDECSTRRKKVVSPWALLASVPAVTAPVYLRDRVVGQTELVALSAPTVNAAGDGAVEALVVESPTGRRRRRYQVAAAAVAVLGIGTTVLLADGGGDDEVAAGPGGAPSTTSAAESIARLPLVTVDPPVIDLRSADEPAVLELRNNSDQTIGFTVIPRDPWLIVTPPDGRLGRRQTVTVHIARDRSAAPPGPARTTLDIRTGTELTTVLVTMSGIPAAGGERDGPAPGPVAPRPAHSAVVLEPIGPPDLGTSSLKPPEPLPPPETKKPPPEPPPPPPK